VEEHGILLNRSMDSGAHIGRVMSIRRTTLILSILASWPVAANPRVQVIHGVYEARISGYCRSITEKDAASGSSGDFRVRKGASLTATGNRHVIYVDAGASVNVTGQSSVIFVAKGGQATVGGARNQVFSEPGARVAILGQAMIATVGELELKLNRNAEDCQ
jgi:hypothetical protein